VRAAERREAIVADAEVQHQLIEQAELGLTEVCLDVTQRAVFLNARRDRVLNVVRRRRDELLTEGVGLTEAARVQVLTDREREVGVGPERVLRRRDQVVVDLEVVDVVACDISNRVATGGERQRLEAPVIVIIRSQRFADVQPLERVPIDVQVGDRAAELAAIARVVAERLNGQPVLFRDCSVKLEEQVQMAERASEYFNFMARSEGAVEIDLAELRESLRPEIDRQVSIWVNLARLETVSAFGSLVDVHAAMDRLFLLCERQSGKYGNP